MTRTQLRVAKGLLFTACLLPLGLMLLETFEVAGRSLGANPVEELIHRNGKWGLKFLLLPLAGIRALRLYENELTRQTEASLVAEGAYVREHFLARILEVAGDVTPGFWSTYGNPVTHVPASSAMPSSTCALTSGTTSGISSS